MGGSASKFNPQQDLPDLSGKIAIVTGGNAGIGLYTVKHLALKNAKVYLCARTESKATGAIAQLEAEGVPTGSVLWLKLDLSSPKGVKAAAEDFLGRETRLDLLINNAAMPIGDFALTEDGISTHMAINYVGHFVLTTTLLPLLRSTAENPSSDVRIINLSSMAHETVSPNVRFRGFEDFNQKFESSLLPSMARYSYTKLANVLFTAELQRRLDQDNVPIIVLAVHPGGVQTPGAYEGLGRYPGLNILFSLMMWWSFVPPDQGSHNSLFAAASPVVRLSPEKYRGKYLVPGEKLKEASKTAGSQELATELWNTTESIIAGAL